MSERQSYNEKEEKEVRKHEEKGGDEKSWEEKWRRDPLGTAAWAVIIIWAGLVLLAENLGLLARLEIADGWGIVFLGAGLILLLEIVVRFVIPDYRRPLMGNFILAFVFLGIGLGNLFDWRVTGALVLIAVGVGILLQGLLRRR
ncbi:MAG: hypothetical protein H8D78_13205 [Chloroflexi bacterium]|nr:hypothetical protein [Chloroflexota bacterium]